MYTPCTRLPGVREVCNYHFLTHPSSPDSSITSSLSSAVGTPLVVSGTLYSAECTRINLTPGERENHDKEIHVVCLIKYLMIDEKYRLLYYSYLLKISGKLQKRTTNPTDRLAMEFMVSNRTESPLIVRKEQNVKSKIACTD